MKAALLLIVLALALCVVYKSCKKPDDSGGRIPTVLQPGKYRDDRGGRILTVTSASGKQLRVEIGANGTSDRFVDITATPQSIGAQLFQVQGVNRATGSQETLQFAVKEHGQLQVSRLNVSFPDILLFQRE